MIAGTFRMSLRNFELMMDLDTKEYDLLTVTAGDYTVELDITDA